MDVSNAPATVTWTEMPEGPAVRLIDQTLLPGELVLKDCYALEEVCEAIRVLRVRGAPAIGCTAALGVALAVCTSGADSTSELISVVKAAAEQLAATRPTAVNLFWALERMRQLAQQSTDLPPEVFRQVLLDEAQRIVDDDLDRCRRIGQHGAELIPQRANILTHCNAGALATAGYGTALGVIRAAHQQGKDIHVWADETRPLLQGARLTAWELEQEGIPCTVICDSAAASLMQAGQVDCVVVGADRIAANGDVANKIGTYAVAIAADRHKVPFYVAAPLSTLDLSLATGQEIPIEQRSPEEVCYLAGRVAEPICPEGADVYNPAFDVTPAELIAAIITEVGVARQPLAASLAGLSSEDSSAGSGSSS